MLIYMIITFLSYVCCDIAVFKAFEKLLMTVTNLKYHVNITNNSGNVGFRGKLYSKDISQESDVLLGSVVSLGLFIVVP